MARPIHRLSARKVQTIAVSGYHADGGGLYLLVGPTGSKSWVFRYQRHGRRREMGLGPVALVGLAEARELAVAQRRILLAGDDPIETRDVGRMAGDTFGNAADAYIDTHRAAWRNEAQAHQWEQSLRDYGPPRDTPVNRVDTAMVMACLKPIWADKTATATRVRGRIEKVLDWAATHGMRKGDNPARWKGHLENLLPAPAKVSKVKHHAAMPYADAPAFFAKLTGKETRSRVALMFVMLTAARTDEVAGARWSEFDFEAKTWTVPAERIKGGKEHIVPLTDTALSLLADLPRDKPPFAMSENTMLFLLQRQPPKGYGQPYTVHGFRSTFRDWAAETTDTPNEVVEMALAHAISNKVEAAYRRGVLLDKRRALMEAWERYLLSAED